MSNAIIYFTFMGTLQLFAAIIDFTVYLCRVCLLRFGSLLSYTDQ
jgi:hypothetical protein